MKISKSKQELARIISENGGWREGAESAAQCVGGEVSFWHDTATKQRGEDWCGRYLGACDDIRLTGVKLPNWHQTILSREEYFHLYPAPDADGWIAFNGKNRPEFGDEVVEVRLRDGAVSELGPQQVDHWDWIIDGSYGDISAYRLHKHEKSLGELCGEAKEENKHEHIDAKPTIEQLATDYRNAKDYAERKQQEADAAKADAEAKLKALELAGGELGLLVSPNTEKQGPELVITDWRYLQAGDVISVSGKWWEPGSEYTVDENDGSSDAPIRVGGYWAFIGECSFKFIRRP